LTADVLLPKYRSLLENNMLHTNICFGLRLLTISTAFVTPPDHYLLLRGKRPWLQPRTKSLHQ